MRRRKLGLAAAIASVAALIALFIAGIAGFDAADPDALTVTRICGCAAFCGIIVYLGYGTRGFGNVCSRAAVIVPALAVAVNNFPLIPLIAGDAAIDAGTVDIAKLAVECAFIGIFEETAFRGILLPAVAETHGNTKRGLFITALATSALFGCAHLFNIIAGAGVGATLLQVSYSTLIGGMCSLVYMLGGSLWSCALIHAVYDFGGCCVERLGHGRIWTAPEIALTAAVGICAFVYFIYKSRELSPERVRENILHL